MIVATDNILSLLPSVSATRHTLVRLFTGAPSLHSPISLQQQPPVS